ncbi:MAG TPA: GAF domain-containing protein [Candidatus Acidoferrum sp.]|nr:GAF domain-containing protein [Candidatus Acidoferrum sp.]
MQNVSLDRLRQVANLARSVASALDVDTVLRQVVEAVLSLRPRAFCVVRLVDLERGGYRLAAKGGVYEDETDFESVAEVIPFGRGITHAVAQSGQPVLVPDAVGDPRLVSTVWREERGLKVYYGVPISAGGELMGVLNVALSETAPPTAEEREIVDLLASHAAVAIGNARLFAESETRRRTAEALAEVWRFLSETFDAAALGQRIADVVLRALRVRAAVLYRILPGPGDLAVIGRSGEAERFLDASFVMPAGHGVVGLAVSRRQPVVSPDVRVDARIVSTPGMGLGHALCPSLLSLPLVVKGQVVGGIAVSDFLGRVYTDEDLRLAQTFADQAAVALENARLFAETERRRRESLALGNVSHTLAQSLHPGGVAQRVVDCVRDLVGVLAASVFRLDPESGALEETACSGRSPLRDRPLRYPRGTGAVGLSVTERRAVVSNNVLADPRLRFAPDVRAFLENSQIRAILAVPLIVKEQVIGALGLVDVSGRVFTEDDVRLAQAFADQAAVALENARLYADAERRRVEAETLSGLVRTITATLDPASVLRRVAAAARELCGSDIAHILLRDAESDTMFARYGVGHAVDEADAPRIARGRGAGGQAWSTGRPFRTANRPNDPRVRDDYPEAARREGIIATLVVPIWISGQVEGLLYVSNRADRSFTDRDEAILIRLADHAAIAIQNATLYSRLQGLSGRLMEVQEAERRHLARELHDEIGQLLTGLRLTLDVPEPQSPALGERLGQAQALVQELLERIRALSLDLRPSILDDLGVLPALLGHIERYMSQTKIRVHLEHSGLDRRFAPETETGVYRIVQEALTNVARHGHVDEVTVRLWATDDVLGVQVEDHGAGFDPDAVLGTGRSGGLAGLRERAALLNGHLTVETHPGRGVRLTAEVPLNGSLRRPGE